MQPHLCEGSSTHNTISVYLFLYLHGSIVYGRTLVGTRSRSVPTHNNLNNKGKNGHARAGSPWVFFVSNFSLIELISLTLRGGEGVNFRCPHGRTSLDNFKGFGKVSGGRSALFTVDRWIGG